MLLYRLFLCHALLIVLAFSEPRVFEDQYVVLRSAVNLRGGSLEPLGEELLPGIELLQLGARTRSSGVRVVEYDQQQNECDLILQEQSILACSPNFVVEATERFPDRGLGMQSAIERVSVAGSAADLVVAVLDTGVDHNHPALVDWLWRNPEEIPNNGIDDDLNGYIDDVRGVNTLEMSGSTYDDNGHGTHVAGIVAQQLQGRGANIRIMPLKFLDARGLGGIAGVIRAFDYVLAMKRRGVNIRVANNSWGGAPFSEPLRVAVQSVIDNQVAFVAAAGNVANNNDVRPEYPASFDMPALLSVAAVDEHGNLASFSNFGASSVTVAAPGVKVVSAYPGGEYKSMSGTSMAAPFVAGQLALLQAAEPALDSESVVEQLLQQSDSVASLKSFIRDGKLLNLGNGLTNLAPKQIVGGSAASVYSMKVVGVAPSGRERRFVKSGFGLRVELLGVGSGLVPLQMIVGGVQCKTSTEIYMENGRADAYFELASVPRGLRKLTFKAAGVVKRVQVRGRAWRLFKRTLRSERQRRAGVEKLTTVCQSLKVD